MARTQKYTDEQIISALVKKKGMVYLAAALIGCEPKTIYNRAAVSPKVKEAMQTERGKVVDTAEMKLFDAIKKGEPWAIQLALKTLGKSRGYVERSELTGADGTPVAFIEVNRVARAAAEESPVTDRASDEERPAGAEIQPASRPAEGMG